ncbi:MAG: hypothetical protein K8W52_18445 [Deltaproteobacteria bacterium]|nr:hypothetical protein [Deltaproteobacteria bacterium]
MRSHPVCVGAVLLAIASASTAGCSIAARQHRVLGAVADSLALAGAGMTGVGLVEDVRASFGTSGATGAPGDGLIALGVVTLMVGGVVGMLALDTFHGAPDAIVADAPPTGAATVWARPPVPPPSIDAELSRLAARARTATALGNCRDAGALVAQIEARDPDYRDAVVASGAVSPCL